MIVVFLLASGVLLAMGALAVDVGNFHAEKAQLQNGSDAAVVAVAKTCVKTTCDYSTADAATAGTYADANANDNASAVEQVCGSSKGVAFGDCSAGNLCPAPTVTTNWAQVQTKTLLADKSTTALPPIFGKAILGDQYNGTIHACSEAIWGAPGGGTGLALTMSVCDWLKDTASTTVGDPNAKYATPAPPYRANPWPPAYPGPTLSNGANGATAVPNPGGENLVQIQGSGKCGAGQSGLNVPGGFAWLSNNPNGSMPANCQVTTDVNGYVYSNPGGIGGQNSPCSTALQNIYNASTGNQSIPNNLNPVFIPIFDLACNSSGKLMPDATQPCPAGMPTSSYHIVGYAQFVLTGYHYNPLDGASLINGGNPCGNGNSFTCLFGLFTQSLVQTTNVDICIPSDTNPCKNLGPTVVKMVG